MSNRSWLLFLALGFIWGMPYLLIRVAVESLDPLMVAFGRTLIGSMLLIPIALYRDALAPVFKRWKWLVAFTLVEISGPWLLLGHAETRLNSSTTGVLIAMAPMMAAVLVTVLGHERLGARRIGGLAMGFIGVATLVGLDIHFDDLVAVGALVLASVGYAVGPVILDRKLKGLPSLGVVTASIALAFVIYLPFVPGVWPSRFDSAAVASVAGLGVFCTAAAFLIFFALIADVGPARATVVAYVNPLVAVALGVLFLREPLTLGMAIGFPLVVAGSILATSPSRASGTRG